MPIPNIIEPKFHLFFGRWSQNCIKEPTFYSIFFLEGGAHLFLGSKKAKVDWKKRFNL
jgi:hypothetical protein